MNGYYVLTFLATVFLSSLLTPLFRKLAPALKILDIPDGIKTHNKPIPCTGGASIYFSFLTAILLIYFLFRTEYIASSQLSGILTSGEGADGGGGSLLRAMHLRSIFPKREVVTLLGGASIIFLLGAIDDIREVPFYVKLIVQAVSAIILVLGGVRLTIIFFPEVLNILLSILWVIVITNSFNIIDVTDGLSGGICFIASIIFFAIALVTGQVGVAFLSLCLAGSTLGFLGYNFHPATIFMGNMGSGLIGFLISAVAMAEGYTGRNNLALLSPLLILSIPIYDTVLVTILRLRKKKSIFKGSHDHFALRLRAFGFSVRKTALISYLASFCLGIVTFIIVRINFWDAFFVLVIVGVLFFLASLKLAGAKVA